MKTRYFKSSNKYFNFINKIRGKLKYINVKLTKDKIKVKYSMLTQ